MKARLSKRLSKLSIDHTAYQGPGGACLWDSQMPGFGARIYPTRRKPFVVTYWSRGRRRFDALGPFGELTSHQAKEEALEVLLKVRRGRDPAADRQRAKSSPTMADLADRHIYEHARVEIEPRTCPTQWVKRDRRAWDRCMRR
ncbi:MAG: Arm DNA-binding domain-containing protein [Holophagales bacterium]|nr:Arm DNA-binding domain-containing protein [Holophagales bacterium]